MKTTMKSVNINRIKEISAKPDFTPFLTLADLQAMLKFADKLMKLGFKAQEVIIEEGYGGSIKTQRLPELNAVFPVPCSTLRMGLRIVLHGKHSVRVIVYRSDSVITEQMLEGEPIVIDVHNIDTDRYIYNGYNISTVGETNYTVCKTEHEIRTAINAFKLEYASEIDRAILHAKQIETAKELLENINTMGYVKE